MQQNVIFYDTITIMSKQEAFMIRIDAEKHAQLKHIADATNIKLVDIGRHAVDAVLSYADDVGINEVTFPLRYPTQLRKQNEKIDSQQQRIIQLESYLTRIASTIPATAAEPPAEYNATSD